MYEIRLIQENYQNDSVISFVKGVSSFERCDDLPLRGSVPEWASLQAMYIA